MKMKRIILLLIPLLVIASACTFFQRMEIYPMDVAGMIEGRGDDSGFLVVWSVSGGRGVLVVDPGDGCTPEEFTGGDVITAEHLYTTKGYFEVTFNRGGLRGEAAVTVGAPGFELNHPFWVEGEMVGLWEEILFDPFPRIIHCDNEDSYKSGLWPDDAEVYMIPGPFGEIVDGVLVFRMFDPVKLSEDFEMRIYVTTTAATTAEFGAGGAAYGKGGEVITGEWVPLQTFRVIADWPWAKPPYPLQILPKGCDPEDPWIPPVIPGDAKSFLVRQEVRSIRGVYEAVQWNIYVPAACD